MHSHKLFLSGEFGQINLSFLLESIPTISEMAIRVTQSENDYYHAHFREFQKLGHGDCEQAKK